MNSDHDSSDDFDSDSGHEVFSAITSTCVISPDVDSSNEGQMKNIVTDDKEARGLVAAALNSQEQRDSSWLNIDHFFNSDLKDEDDSAEGKCQETEDIEDKMGPDDAENDQAEDGSQNMHHSVNEAENEFEDGDEIKHDEEDVIADTEMKNLKMNDEEFHDKNDHTAGVGVDEEDWW